MSKMKMPADALEFFEIAYKKSNMLERLLKKPALANMVFNYFMKPMAFDHLTEKNSGFRFGYISTGAGVLPKEDLEFFEYIMQSNSNFFKKVITAIKENKPMIGSIWAFTGLISKGFDVVDITLEAIGKYAYSIDFRLGLEYFNLAESERFIKDGCSYQRSAFGGLLSGHLPKLNAFVSYTHPCDSIVTVYQNFDYLYDVPSFVIDSPYDRSDKSIKYVAEQLRELIGFLEKTLNQKFDWDKFKKAIDEYNKFCYYYYELSQMARNVPSPVSGLELHTLWTAKTSVNGVPELTKAAEVMYEIAKKRLQNSKGVLKDEKIRIAWWEPPLAFTSLHPWIESKFNAVVIADYITYTMQEHVDTTSEDTMLEGVARLDLLHGMSRQAHGKTELASSELQTIIDEYSPHCVIFSGNQGCRYAHAHARIMYDLCKKNNIPYLPLSVDILDPKVCSEVEIKNQIEEFFKMNGWA